MCSQLTGLQVAAKYPSRAEHRLLPGELSTWFSASDGFSCLCNDVHVFDDGRKVSHFLAQKKVAL
jgi:hypothetical protein